MPPDYIPGDDDEEEGQDPGEEGDDKGADAEGGDDAATKQEPKPEDQEKEDASPTGEDASEESEEGEKPADTDAADIKAKLLEILEDRDEQNAETVKVQIADGIKAEKVAAAAEADAEAEATVVNDLFAKVDGEDELESDEALKEIGRRTVEVRKRAQIEAPIIEKATKEAAKEFDGIYQGGMDRLLKGLGYADVANSLTDADKAKLDPRRFDSKEDWTEAVGAAVRAKADGGSSGDAKAKAERRNGTAERARAGGGTTRLPRGRSDDEAEGKGQTAREYILGKK